MRSPSTSPTGGRQRLATAKQATLADDSDSSTDMPRGLGRAGVAPRGRRVMGRLRLTLDEATSEALARHARQQGKPRAALARELIREAITRREALERQRR